MHYATLSPQQAVKELQSRKTGLTSEEVERRVKRFGKNVIAQEKKTSWLSVFLHQFTSPLVIILIIAAVIASFLGEVIDSILIGIIIVGNAILGFIQEWKAEKSLAALKKLTALQAKVMRAGKPVIIPAEDLVPGDIIMIEAGDKVPADARLLSCVNLEVQEASLTGESTPVVKDIEKKGKAALAEQTNMLFSSTIITKGNATALVTHTGKESEIGKIAHHVQKAEEGPTPLQLQLKSLAKMLGIVVLGVAVCIILLGLFQQGTIAFIPLFIFAVALAVAAIPEGLPAVVTITLALGVKRLVQKHALIRKLPSVETLGSCSVICTDKTGTLTHNEMTVTKLWANNNVMEVSGSGYDPVGTFSEDPKNIQLLLQAGLLCNNAQLVKEKEYKIIGDPTEGSLLVAAKKAGITDKEFPRVKEIPFTSERKMMTTVHKHKGKYIAFTKGAPDILLAKCSHILIDGKKVLLTKEQKKEILKQNEIFASEALRVLACAYKSWDKKESGFIFLGLQGMIDPPREEVKEAITRCKQAGIKVIMITGDHKTTAVAIAKQLSIEGKAVEGKELKKAFDVENTTIYARVNPQDKSTIIKALKKKGHIIAMTGDGVNDAPALKDAAIGIAMGSGTDVAREASDMVLTDDNFASIVNAVEEGRGMYANLRKFVGFLLSCNAAEVIVIALAMVLGLHLPLTAVQLLWMNLVTDGLPALALAVEPKDKDIMEEQPRNAKEHIIHKPLAWNITSTGLIMAGLVLAIYLYMLIQGGWTWGAEVSAQVYLKATTVAFTALVVAQLARAFTSKRIRSFFSNKALLLAVVTSFLLQLAVLYTPLNSWFGTTPLSGSDWILIGGVALATFVLGELTKVVPKLLLTSSNTRKHV